MFTWKNLLNALRGEKTNGPLSSFLGEEDLAVCQTINLKRYEPTLIVPKKQCATIDQGADNAKFYPAGEHALKDLAQDKAKVLFIREGAQYQGSWQLDYQDHFNERLALSGEGTLLISHCDQFASNCLADPEFRDQQSLQRWLSKAIEHILRNQRIPCQDIHAKNTRFAQFLRDTLAIYFRPKGLTLENLSLDIQAVVDEREQSDHDAASEEAAPASTHMVITQKTTPEKLFYRIFRGQQQGPLSAVEVQALIDDGTLRRHDLLWHKGLSAWSKAETFDVFDWS
ncbi:DUF4339 domain-containing protein [Suttonella sp. R2A3]|uniref:DUF4339 domain-containing protein n=1 Tax=Suttonella sp. R2A3 TaxID=2908648 RepID=UPI001F1FB98E|nr:DUF4339 domain-containing protein [Suttonella sp. R2A3]UJF24710.1 DUF4339 domain-containing protein [Suttonella sp. R2A3]